MSKSYNTDGMLVFPYTDNELVINNALESIECAIAFDVRDWAADRRSAWIYAIVFGWDDDSWEELKATHGWDEKDRQRALAMHEQWEKAKAAMKEEWHGEKEEGPCCR